MSFQSLNDSDKSTIITALDFSVRSNGLKSIEDYNTDLASTHGCAEECSSSLVTLFKLRPMTAVRAIEFLVEKVGDNIFLSDSLGEAIDEIKSLPLEKSVPTSFPTRLETAAAKLATERAKYGDFLDALRQLPKSPIPYIQPVTIVNR